MKTVELIGHTKRACNRLKQHGKRWEILHKGPQGVMLRSLYCTLYVSPKRWEQDLRLVKYEKAQLFSIDWNTLQNDPYVPQSAGFRSSEQKEINLNTEAI